MSKYFICGVDPGITTAFAALDLNGNVIKIKSSKKFGLESLIKELVKIGRPIVIACDVENPPILIKKLAARFKAKVIAPRHDLKTGEKQRLVSESKIKTENIHQKDALSAALYALKVLRTLFKKIERVLEDKGLKEKIDEVKKKIILGEAETIKDALIEKPEPIMLQAKKRKRETTKKSEKKKLKEEIRELKNKIEELNYEIKKLKLNLEIAKRKKGSEELMKLAENRKATINTLKTEIDKLKKRLKEKDSEIEKLSKKIILTKEGFIFIKKLKDLSEKEVKALNEADYGDVLFAEKLTKISKESAEKLNKLNIKYIIFSTGTKGLENEISEKGFEPIKKNEINILKVDNFEVLEKEKLEKVKEKLKIKNLKKIVEEYKKRFKV